MNGNDKKQDSLQNQTLSADITPLHIKSPPNQERGWESSRLDQANVRIKQNQLDHKRTLYQAKQSSVMRTSAAQNNSANQIEKPDMRLTNSSH